MKKIKQQLKTYQNGVHRDFFLEVIKEIEKLEAKISQYEKSADLIMISNFLELDSKDQDFILENIKFLKQRELIKEK